MRCVGLTLKTEILVVSGISIRMCARYPHANLGLFVRKANVAMYQQYLFQVKTVNTYVVEHRCFICRKYSHAAPLPRKGRIPLRLQTQHSFGVLHVPMESGAIPPIREALGLVNP